MSVRAARVIDASTPHEGDSPRGEGIGAQFVDRCRDLLDRQVREAHAILNAFTGNRVVEVSEWINTQPHAQRQSLRWLQDMATRICVVTLSNANDHALALRDLLDEPDDQLHEWAYVTLARTVVETATLVAYMGDRRVEPEKRLLRAGAALLQGNLEEKRLAASLGNDQAGKEVLGEHARLQKRFEKCRMRMKVNAKGMVVGIERGQFSAPLAFNVTAETEARFTRMVAPYRIGSATAHSAWWYLASSTVMEGNQLLVQTGVDNITNAVAMVLDSYAVMVEACADLGQKEAMAHLNAATDRRLQILLRSRELA